MLLTVSSIYIRSQHAKDFILFSKRKYQEKNLKAEYLLSCGKNNALYMKTVFKYTVDCKLGSSQCNQ